MANAPLETHPGSAPYPPELAERILAARAALPAGTLPRTRHRDGAVPRFTNRLILETSPYLRQHAHNPVDWRPWGDEAFSEARRTGRPVFVSVGYSTCHWCHVMEEESFEDPEIASVLNAQYVPIKVDREERPDVDAVYMAAVQALNGHGGWPMSVWLDADRRPFFGGTYFPARDGDRGSSRGFLSILRELASIHAADPDRVARAAESITDAVRTSMSGGPEAGRVPGTGAIRAAVAVYERIYDPRNGGTAGAPKFPSSMPARLLLRHHRRTGDARSLAMAVHTLERIAAGGIHDQLGGGFHRYSVDESWLVPHFEKMLYDNALLAVSYAEAWQVTGRPDFARVLRTTLDYLLREMTSPEGGFWSATDADSEGEEGRFFAWSEDEIRRVLGADADRFVSFHGVTRRGHFEGGNVLSVPRPDEATWESLSGARAALLAVRSRRPPPLLDDKVLAAWNGLAISAAAVGGRVLGEARHVEAARRAAAFVLGPMRVDGRLQRAWRDGRTSGPGFLEDQAFVVQGLLDLYEATFEARWLAAALELAAQGEVLFGDHDGGGWFRTAGDHERLVAREKPGHDGAEPSGASAAALNALRLHAFTSDDAWRKVAVDALRANGATLERHPTALHDMLLAVDFLTDDSPEIVLAWAAGSAPPATLTDVLRRTFFPNRILAGVASGAGPDPVEAVAPVTRGKVPVGGTAAAYVCESGTCELPSTDPAALAARLARVKPL